MKYAFLLIGLICGIFWFQVFEAVSLYINGQGLSVKTSQVAQKNKIVSVSTPTIESIKQPLESSSKNVLMYSTSWCGYCNRAREHFIKNKISFLEYDIEKDDRANRMHALLGGGGVPLIIYNGKMMRGFSESKFVSLYR